MDVCDLEHGAISDEEFAEEQATDLPAGASPAPVPVDLAARPPAVPAAGVHSERPVAAGDALFLAPVD